MKINEYNQMMSYLTKPPSPYTKEEKKEIVKDFYKKTAEPKAKPMPIVKYIDKMNRLYGDGGGEVGGTAEQVKGYLDLINNPKKSLPVGEIVKQEERFNDRIQEQARNKKYKIVPNNVDKSTPPKNEPKEPVVEKAPKRIAKKPVEQQLQFEDWLNVIDPQYWLEEEEEKPPKPTKSDIEKILNIKRKEVAGLEAILSPGRKQT